jgi:lysophospholipase L1-like esterase
MMNHTRHDSRRSAEISPLFSTFVRSGGGLQPSDRQRMPGLCPSRMPAGHLILLFFAFATTMFSATSAAAASPSFAAFDARARAGDRLTVVFFGASLTWGANATDQNYFSYRARVASRLTEKYPLARFSFHDAAIGGTGSQLGVFRLDRDVLARKPDLVFVDFTANDDISSGDPETLASYESIIRRLVTEAQVPVVQVLFPFKWNIDRKLLETMKRRDAHTAISAAYGTGIGDAVLRVIEQVEQGGTTTEKLWDTDGVHPGNAGYDLFAAAAWDGYLEAVAAKKTCSAPERMLHASTYMKQSRVRLSSLANLPAGWRRGKPNLVSAYFDMLMSRWLDGEVIGTNRRETPDATGKKTLVPQEVAPLEVTFRGEMVLLFGEGTPKSGRYRAFVDGKLVERTVPNAKEPLREFDAAAIATPSRGNAHHVAVIATGLDPTTDHTLRIEPVFDPDKEQELRLESVCVAGGDARVLAIAPR